MAIVVSEEQRRYVENEIKYDQVQFQHKAKNIKEWMKKQPHFPKIQEKHLDNFIQAFLFGTKLNTEVVKTKLDTYFSMRHQMPDLFHNMDPTAQDFRDSADRIYHFPLRELTPEGLRVSIVTFHSDKEKRFTAKDMINLWKRALAIADVRMMLQDELVGGDIIVYDCGGFQLSHITEMPYSIMQKAISYSQAGLPLRVKGIFLINAASYMETVLNLLKPFLKDKVKKRIHLFQGDHTNLYKYIPRRILPSDFGGEAPSIEESSRAWQQTLESHREFLMNVTTKMTDESLRPRDSTNTSGQLFGVNGSFTRLNID